MTLFGVFRYNVDQSLLSQVWGVRLAFFSPLHEALNSKHLSSLGKLNIKSSEQILTLPQCYPPFCVPHMVYQNRAGPGPLLWQAVQTPRTLFCSAPLFQRFSQLILYMSVAPSVFLCPGYFYVLIFWCWFSHHSHVFVCVYLRCSLCLLVGL